MQKQLLRSLQKDVLLTHPPRKKAELKLVARGTSETKQVTTVSPFEYEFVVDYHCLASVCDDTLIGSKPRHESSTPKL